MFIKDEVLKEIIASTLLISKEKITQKDMEKLTTLTARCAGITKINGLEYAKNLEYLDISGNMIEVLDPLQS